MSSHVNLRFMEEVPIKIYIDIDTKKKKTIIYQYLKY